MAATSFLRQGPQRQAAEEDLGLEGEDADLALGLGGARAVVDHLAIEADRDRIGKTVAFERVPLPCRLLSVAGTVVALHVAPARAHTAMTDVPVDERLGWRAGAVFIDGHRLGRAGNHALFFAFD